MSQSKCRWCHLRSMGWTARSGTSWSNAAAMKAVGKLPKEEQQAARTPLIEEGRRLRERDKTLEVELHEATAARDEAWARVPNLTHPESPRGHSDEAHKEVSFSGERRDFGAEGFEPKDHLEIAERLDLVDFAAGAKVAGQKFYYLKNEAVLLDMALQHYALGVAIPSRIPYMDLSDDEMDLIRSGLLDGLKGSEPRRLSIGTHR